VRCVIQYTVEEPTVEDLTRLRDLAANLRWTWDRPTQALFASLSPARWSEARGNPVELLRRVTADEVEARLADPEFRQRLQTVAAALAGHRDDRQCWLDREHPAPGLAVALVAEGLACDDRLQPTADPEAFAAGDELKGAAALGVPVVGIALLERSGWPDAGREMPPLVLEEVDGEPLIVTVPLAEGDVACRVWRLDVGRAEVYYLDADTPARDDGQHRRTGGSEPDGTAARLRRSLLLGAGAHRLVEALGLPITVYYLRGPTAWPLALERLCTLMERHELAFGEAVTLAGAGLVFATDAPPLAPPWRLAADVVEGGLAPWRERLGRAWPDLMALGRPPHDSAGGPGVCPIALLARLAHGRLAAGPARLPAAGAAWQTLYPHAGPHELPVTAYPPAVHLPSSLATALQEVVDRHLGEEWRDDWGPPAVWQRLQRLPAAEVWEARCALRRGLATAWEHATLPTWPTTDNGEAGPETIDRLDPDALTVGVHGVEALVALLAVDDPPPWLTDPARPVQWIVLGDGPRDSAAAAATLGAALRDRPGLAARLHRWTPHTGLPVTTVLHGLDLWIEGQAGVATAHGRLTALGGALLLPHPDGPWGEHAGRTLAWPLLPVVAGEDAGYAPGDLLSALFTTHLLPAFFERTGGTPSRWIEGARQVLHTHATTLSAQSVAARTCVDHYLPRYRHSEQIDAGAIARVRALARWQEELRRHWRSIRVVAVRCNEVPPRLGETLAVEVRLALGPIEPMDLRVEAHFGPTDGHGELRPAHIQRLAHDPMARGPEATFRGHLPVERGGRHGVAIRILPGHPGLPDPLSMGLGLWA